MRLRSRLPHIAVAPAIVLFEPGDLQLQVVPQPFEHISGVVAYSWRTKERFGFVQLLLQPI
jgi:hypothetical protein